MADNDDKPTGDEVDEVELEDAELEAVQGGTKVVYRLDDPQQSKRCL